MAVIHFIEYKGETSKQLTQQAEYLVPTYTGTRNFQVIVDDPATPHSEIYGHTSCPRLFEPHPDEDGIICKKVTIQQSDDEASYELMLTAEYDDQYNGSETEDEEDNNPLNRPLVIQGGVSEFDQVMVRDINGVPIRNSAKDPFDPPVTRKAGNFRFSITKNYASLNIAMMRTYKNAINSDFFYGFAIGAVRIANITFSKQIETWKPSEEVTLKLVYYQVTYDFEVAEVDFGGDGTWKKYVLDQGYRTYSGSTAIAIKDKEGLPVSTPQLLNGSGATANPNSPYWLSFDLYRSLPFAALGLF